MPALRRTEPAFDILPQVKDMSLSELLEHHNRLSTELFFFHRSMDRKSIKLIEEDYEEALGELYRRRKNISH